MWTGRSGMYAVGMWIRASRDIRREVTALDYDVYYLSVNSLTAPSKWPTKGCIFLGIYERFDVFWMAEKTTTSTDQAHFILWTFQNCDYWNTDESLNIVLSNFVSHPFIHILPVTLLP